MHLITSKATLPRTKRCPDCYGAAGAWADALPTDTFQGSHPPEGSLPFGDDEDLPEVARPLEPAAPTPPPPPPPRRRATAPATALRRELSAAKAPDLFAAIKKRRRDADGAENDAKPTSALLGAIRKPATTSPGETFTSPRRAMADLLQSALANRRVD